jgi:hypothetical protein
MFRTAVHAISLLKRHRPVDLSMVSQKCSIAANRAARVGNSTLSNLPLGLNVDYHICVRISAAQKSESISIYSSANAFVTPKRIVGAMLD